MCPGEPNGTWNYLSLLPAFPGLRSRRAFATVARVSENPYLLFAFPASALHASEKLGDIARELGLVTWTTALTDGSFQIRVEGDRSMLRVFASTVGFRNAEAALPADAFAT